MIDLGEARKLVHALEQDLDRLRDGDTDLQPLRDEVDRLRAVLQGPDPGHGWVRDALQDIHAILRDGADTAKLDAIIAGRYLTAIARMLGL